MLEKFHHHHQTHHGRFSQTSLESPVGVELAESIYVSEDDLMWQSYEFIFFALRKPEQGGIKGEGALTRSRPAQLFLTASSLKFQIPDRQVIALAAFTCCYHIQKYRVVRLANFRRSDCQIVIVLILWCKFYLHLSIKIQECSHVLPMPECHQPELFTLRSASAPSFCGVTSTYSIALSKFGADELRKWKFSNLCLFLHLRSTLVTGFRALQILKESLDTFLSAITQKNGVPGEEILSGLLDSSGSSVPSDVVISALRTLCKKSSVSNILASHGINLVRGRQIKITYRTGETFQLEEFSGEDLNLRDKSMGSKRVSPGVPSTPHQDLSLNEVRHIYMKCIV